MGNQPSSHHPAPQEGAPSSRPLSHTLPHNLRNLLRSPTGALGLSKTELDKRCQPSGLYDKCLWEDKAIRRLIGDGKLAARLKGNELRTTPADTECPICFLHYPEVNVTKCCQATLCSECYLQVRPQREHHAACPFCNSPKVQISVAKVLDPLAIQKREEEEQKVIEAKIRERAAINTTTQIQQQQFAHPPDDHRAERSVSVDDTTTVESDDVTETISNHHHHHHHQSSTSSNSNEFGASLAQNDRVALMRARSESFASETSSHHNYNTSSECLLQDITALAMTPEERTLLEQEMRIQHSHPLAQRMEAEQMERRLQNERDYVRTQAGRLRELRARRELMGRALGLHTLSYRLPPSSSSDSRLAAPLSARGARDWTRIVDSYDSSGNSSRQSALDDLVVLEAAIMLSMEEEARRLAEEQQDADADAGDDTEGQGSDRLAARDLPSASNGTAELGAHMTTLMQSIQARRRGQEMFNARRYGMDSETVSSMLVGAMSEEAQIAMAIAASLAESSASETGPSSEAAIEGTAMGASRPPSQDSPTESTEPAQMLPVQGGRYPSPDLGDDALDQRVAGLSMRFNELDGDLTRSANTQPLSQTDIMGSLPAESSFDGNRLLVEENELSGSTEQSPSSCTESTLPAFRPLVQNTPSDTSDDAGPN